MNYRTHLLSASALVSMLILAGLAVLTGIAVACSGTGGGGSECSPPAVSTGSATAITSNSATLNGSVNPQGCEATYSFEYGPSSGGYPNSISGFAGSEASTQFVSTHSPLGLQPSTAYHFRLSASNEGGTTIGGSSSFTTTAACSKPSVTTQAATSVMSDRAFLNGTVNPNGCTATYTFEYGLAGTGTFTKLTGSVAVFGPFAIYREAIPLQANRLYTFRLSAVNSVGKTDGSFLNFETKPKYVALGDSYSAGNGTGTSYEPNNSGDCHRTTKSYPYLLHLAHPDWGFVSAACGGAKTSELIGSQSSALTQDTTWVTYTIGGNDVGFEDVIETCFPPETTNCLKRIDTAQAFIKNNLPALLDNVNNTIKNKASTAKVIVLSYPRIFNGEDCNMLTFFDPVELQRLNDTADQLRSAISAAAARAGANFYFRDAIPGFLGHAVCDPPGSGEGAEWINGASFPVGESYHPKIEGHANVYSPLVHSVTG